MGMPSKRNQERARRIAQIGRKEDMSSNDKETTRSKIQAQLEQATARLNQMQAAGDAKGIAKMNEIIANITQTLNRMK